MSEKKLGQEPAFPVIHETFETSEGLETIPTHPGMSKRFYAACAAMQGILANRALIDNNGDSEIEWVVFTAYKAADEMLKQEIE